MPRKYKQKTNRADITEDRLKNAARMVKDENISIRAASKEWEIDRMTLTRYLSKGERGYDITSATHRVFSNADEASLADHIKTLDSCFHGLNREKCRELAFDYARLNHIDTPSNWTKDGMAGE